MFECVCVHSVYGANEIHFHFKATSQQQEKLLSSVNVILGEERDSKTHAEGNTVHRAWVIISLQFGNGAHIV